MAQPRFVFVVGAAGAGRRWVPTGAGLPPPGGDVAAEELAGWVGWRLTGGNNHELGRSAALFPDLAGCRAAVGRLQRDVGLAVAVVSAESLTALWRWRIELAGQPVAVCGRAYQRQRECLYSVRQFLAAARVAGSAPHVVVLSGDRHEQPGRAERPDPGAAFTQATSGVRPAVPGPPAGPARFGRGGTVGTVGA